MCMYFCCVEHVPRVVIALNKTALSALNKDSVDTRVDTLVLSRKFIVYALAI